MGMYTELRVCCRLKKDTPEAVIKALQWMTDGDCRNEHAWLYALDHPFFKCGRWSVIFRGGSVYFDDPTSSAMVRFRDQWHLLSVANFKNYDSEISKFVDWISPYIDAQPGEVWATHRYEEFDEETPIAA
jgi:hypothetical protein